MKKKLLMLVMAVTMVCLVGCKKDDTQQNIPNNNDVTPVVESGDVSSNETIESGDEVFFSGDIDIVSYQEVRDLLPDDIKDYTAAFNSIEIYINSKENLPSNDFGVSSLLTYLKNESDPYSNLSYALKDVNGDGVKEILIYDNNLENKNVIVSMYTLRGEEKEIYHVLNSQTNYHFILCENNVIKSELVDVEDTGETYVSYATLDKEYNFVNIEIPSGETPTYAEANLTKNPVK